MTIFNFHLSEVISYNFLYIVSNYPLIYLIILRYLWEGESQARYVNINRQCYISSTSEVQAIYSL